MATVSVSSASPARGSQETYSLSGLSASTDYTALVTDGTGQVTRSRFVTDGSGNGSFVFVPQTFGKVTVAVRPTAEHTGTTTAAVTDQTVAVKF